MSTLHCIDHHEVYDLSNFKMSVLCQCGNETKLSTSWKQIVKSKCQPVILSLWQNCPTPISYVVKMLKAKMSMANMFTVKHLLDPPIITVMRCKMEWTLNKCSRHLIYKRIAINVVAVLPLYFILQISFAKFSSLKLNFFCFRPQVVMFSFSSS